MANKYERWIRELWNGDLDELPTIARRVVTDEFVGNWPGQPGLVHGPDELAAVIRQGREMFDELSFDIEVGPIEQDDLVAGRWVATGKYQGAPSEFRGHDLLRHDGDRFTEYWVIAEDPTAG